MRYSVIIPLHNEEHSVGPLYRSLVEVMGAMNGRYEILFVDDASTDKTVENLKRVPGQDLGFKILSLRERKGMASALQAGFDAAQGELFITLDGDLQNDPGDIPALLSKLNEGYDLVCGWRKERSDPASKKAASYLANTFRRLATGEKVHDVGCTLRAFKKEVVRGIRLSGGLHRYFTALASRQGFRIAEVAVRHHARRHSCSKFGNWGRFCQGSADLFRVAFFGAGLASNTRPDYTIQETLCR